MQMLNEDTAATTTTDIYYSKHQQHQLPGSPLTRSPSPQPSPRRTRTPTGISPIGDGYRRELALLHTREKSFTVTPPTPTTTPTWLNLREEVVSWFIDVCAELSLSQPVVAISTNILDRFVSITQPSTDLIAPLAAACLLIASKVAEDESAPSVSHLSRRVGLRTRHLISAESSVLSTLNWRVNVVTPHEVARELLDALGGASTFPSRALRELETLALAASLEHALIGVPPTSIATAAVVTALESVPRNNSTADAFSLATLRVNSFVLARDSGFDVDEVDSILPILRASIRRIIDSEVLELDN